MRALSSGIKTWHVQCRGAQGVVRERLGDARLLMLSDARGRADARLHQLRRDRDGEVRDMTLGQAVAEFLERKGPDYSSKQRGELKRYLEQDWSLLHGLKLSRITKRRVIDRLDEISARAPIGANRARGALSVLMTWAKGRDYASSNVVTDVPVPTEEKEGERTLSLDELAIVWRCSGESDYGRIVRLLILTAVRKGEAGGLAWPEIDGIGLWTIPGSRTKNGLPHEIPLPQAALALLETVPRQDGRDLVFGRGKAGYSGWSRSKARLDVAIARERARLAGAEIALRDEVLAIGDYHKREKAIYEAHRSWMLPDWDVHDLRRTCSTMLNEHGLAHPHVVEACLNHVDGPAKRRVAGTYNKALYRAQKAAAFRAWERFLTEHGIIPASPDASGDQAEPTPRDERRSTAA